jgi:hypothetical protein
MANSQYSICFEWQSALLFNYELNVVDKIGENAVAGYRALISSFFTKARIKRMKLIYNALLPSFLAT